MLKKRRRKRKRKKTKVTKIIKKNIGTKLITNTKKQKFKISFRRQWAAFLDIWCPLLAFRSCFVESTWCLNVVLMNLWGRKWSPRPIPPHPRTSFPGGLLYSFGGILLLRFFLMSYALVDVCTFKKAVICTRIYILISVGKAFRLWVGEHWNVQQGAISRGIR